MTVHGGDDMTEEELNKVFEVRARIEKAIGIIVNAGLKLELLTQDQEDLIRMQLTEEYRFWD